MIDTPLIIGRFGRPFGILGWIKVISFTTPEENILKFNTWLIQENHTWHEIVLDKTRKQARSIIVKLPPYNSPEEVSSLTNTEIGIWPKQLPKLPTNEYYWSDLVESEVINKEGSNLGVVQKLIATGANDVLVVVGKRKYLIPYISSVILDIDLNNKTIQVDWGEDFL